MTDLTPITARLDHAAKWFEDCALTWQQAHDLRRYIDDLEARVEELTESRRKLGEKAYALERDLDKECLPT